MGSKPRAKVERMIHEVKESFLPWLSGQVLPRDPTLVDYRRVRTTLD